MEMGENARLEDAGEYRTKAAGVGTLVDRTWTGKCRWESQLCCIDDVLTLA